MILLSGGHCIWKNFFQVHLAKEEVAVLREIARNISASGKEVNLWEVMNAVNATIRDNPNSPVSYDF